MDEQTGTIKWSSLPKDLLSTIAKSLTTRTDLRHFRAVCSSWRSSTCLPTKSRFKIPACFTPPIPDGYFSLGEYTVYCIQPLNQITNTKSWFIELQENPRGLVDPLSRLDISGPTKLPKTMPKTINLLDYKVTEITTVFRLLFMDSELFPVNKVVTSSTFLDGDFIVFGLPPPTLFAWRMGDDTMTAINHSTAENSRYYHDVAFYKGKVYVVNFDGLVLVMDSSFNITEIASAVGLVELLSYKRLVMSFGELFLLAKGFIKSTESESDNTYSSVYWKVYKLNEENNDWVLVNSLGDCAFFVSYHSSFSVSAQDFPGCKGNSIYFDDNIFTERKGDYPGCRAGIYDLEDGSVGPLSAFPGYSDIFWPPPTWLKPNPPSS